MSSVREEIIKEIFKPARINYPRMKIVVKGLWETLSADLLDMQKYAKYNKNYRYILTVIDHFSKWAWAIPVKNKSAPVVTAAMKKILDEGHPVKNIFTDDGKEFYNSDFEALMKKFKVNRYHTYSGIKSGMIERFNRTLRHMLHPAMLVQGNSNWLKLLPKVIHEYNHEKKHRTIKMTPVEATDPSKEKEILVKVYRKNNLKIVKKTKKPKFKVGDFVRVSKKRLTFEKGYTPSYSMEIFRIAKVKLSNPRTYLLKDLEGEEIKGRFYEEEMQKTKFPHEYIVEKVLRKKGNKCYVKFLGFETPQWINKKDFV